MKQFVNLAKVAYAKGRTNLAMAALSIAYDLSYVQSLRETEAGVSEFGTACARAIAVLIDGRLLPYGTMLRSTVVVVGAGPAGLTVAQELAAAAST